MFYLLYGTDFEKIREKRGHILSILEKKRPDAEVFWLDPESINADSLEELASGQGLFDSKYIIVGNTLFSDSVTKDVLLENIDIVCESPNVFIFTENTLDAKTLKSLEEKAEKTYRIDTQKTHEYNDAVFNLFSLSDAYGKRDKRLLWVLYHKALRRGVSNEEIHGILFWQNKSLLLAQSVSNPADAAMKPYPFNKAKAYAKNFSQEELISRSSCLVSLYHDTRRGESELHVALEKFILDMP